MEFYLREGKLIPKKAWEEEITKFREETGNVQLAFEDLKEHWLAAFERAILLRVEDARRLGSPIGVLFSGGVDSTFVCHVLWKNAIPFTCYTIGFKDPKTKEPEDIIEARKVAAAYGWQHKERVLDLEELRPIVEETSRMLGDAANPVSVGVGTVIVAAAQLAAQDKCKTFFGGLGSEEIFAGYHRHGKAHARGAGQLDDEAWRGLSAMYERDLVRDSRIAAALGIRVHTPFLEPTVIIYAMRMLEEAKIKSGVKKYVLRKMAEAWGMPHDYAFRPRRAAQYGSRLHKTIDRLASRAGMTQDDYIQSLFRSKIAPSRSPAKPL